MGERILVVDDEPQITRVLRHALEAQGFEVRVANSAEAGLAEFNQFHPALVVTDLAMPSMDGIQLCSRIRLASQLPILVLSVKGEEQTKVRALDAGADDYVTKPFGIDELLARVRALLRRAEPPSAARRQRLEVGDFVVDPESRRIFVVGRELSLTPKEFDLLLYLISNPGRVLTHKDILTAVWGRNSASQVEYLRVFVGQLRKKIEQEPHDPRYLKTEPWIGYRFDPS